MTAARARVWLGNGALLIALAAIAAWLASLHQGAWWSAPTLQRWQWAALSMTVYAAVCAAIFIRNRQRAGVSNADSSGMLIAWASQTGFARELAERSAAALQTAGVGAHALPLDAVDADLLARVPRLLCIVSTTGEGDAPDHAQAAERHWLAGNAQDLAAVHYAVLALGDRRYAQFCAFGRRIDAGLQARGGTRLFERIDVDNADPRALLQWQQRLAELTPALASQPAWSVPTYAIWQLRERVHVNPGSAGAPIYRLRLVPRDGALPPWSAGDIAEIAPQNAPAQVEEWLQRHRCDGAQIVDGRALRDWLAGAQLPADPDASAGVCADPAVCMEADAKSDTAIPPAELAAMVPNLVALPHRAYSLASISEEGYAELLIRQHLHDDGRLGIGSGWLCVHARVGAAITLRLRSNPGFHPPAPGHPMLLIGNGTGIAGLRAHLRARIAAGARDNWLIFGERNAAHDALYANELQQWQQHGWIARMDLAYSRDPASPMRYVQHALAAAAEPLREWIDRGACIYLCGSLRGMAPEVDRTLDTILGAATRQELLQSGRYRRDVY
ncbi:flavodoxin domain-containing protein [Xanthomonas floridensis]|uniref:Sulfite reductase n=1 Tax=Xanthomonas floridensis TaxID=1843580 RepID=A0A1A9MGR4_9XANT|nr:sulfite reductase flavoprotein subunit alpha [Xanthomonas floridensis]MEA5123562.1 sulfite reductase flavoprotein subunit alpha [Xanthomonas floridensis]MEA5130428.1 sulfite reductase flavoprotein subunit alpha [Xanthomonas floridensis]OAG69332.1 sulfite reductase [Xanthomonas floridensis]